MKLSIQYGTKQISFEVTYRKRKTLSIQVEPPDIVKVVAPEGTPKEIILETVRSKGSWIVQKLFELSTIKHIKLNKEFVNGESFMYLGRNYSLQIVTDPSTKKPKVSFYQGKIVVRICTRNEKLIHKAIENWYREKTLEKVKERAKYFQHYFKVKPSEIVVKEQKRRWGSCTSKKKLLFNWRCIMAPSNVLDYIVVHEMCHMVYMNHSKEFWSLVESILPDHKKRREWLKNNGVRLNL